MFRFHRGKRVRQNVARFALMTNDLKVKLQQQQCFTTAQLSVRGLSQNNGENKHLINVLCENTHSVPAVLVKGNSFGK